MLTFRKGTGGAPTAAAAMAEHLREQTIPAELVELADYYLRGVKRAEVAGTAAIPRQDMPLSVAQVLGLDLTRTATHEEVVNLLQGRRADGEAIAGKRETKIAAGKDRITYVDFTFSAPKSVSIAMALAPTDAERHMIVGAHRDAWMAAMTHLETIVAWARKGAGGSKGSVQGSLGWVSFDHYTARPTIEIPHTEADGTKTTLIQTVRNPKIAGDMQLHTHVTTPNLVVCPDGSAGGMDMLALHDRVHEVGAYYQAHLATNLRAFGIDVVLDERTEAARLTAIPVSLEAVFSKRVRDGEAAREYVKAQGLEWDLLHPMELAGVLKGGTRATRRQKETGKRGDDMSDLEAWKAQARAAGYEHASVIRHGPEAQLPPTEQERLTRAYQAALPVLERQWSRRATMYATVARTAAARGLIAAGVDSADDIDRITAAMREHGVRHDGQQVPLIWGEVTEEAGTLAERRTRTKITTTRHVEQEREAMALASKAASDRSGALAPSEIERAVQHVSERDGLDFTTEHGLEQRRVIDALGTSGRFAVAIGVGGAGKTTLLRPLVEAWQNPSVGPRRTVYGTALAWRQSDPLADAGIRSGNTMAIAALLQRAQGGGLDLTPNTVVVVDELSQVGTSQALALLRLQEAHGFSIVALGDDKQAQSIEAGSTIKLLRNALGAGAMPELESSVRQLRDRDKVTSLLFRSGKADEAIERLREDGHAVLVQGGHRHAVEAVADLWEARRRALSDRPDATLTVSAPTNADARAISTAIRERRRRACELGTDQAIVNATDQNGAEYELPLAIGDRVRLFARTSASFGGKGGNLGHNGSVVTVEKIEDEGLQLRNAKGNTGFVKWDTLRDPTNERIRLTYGDVITLDAIQSATSTEHINAMPGGSEAVQAFKAYVGQSRSRETTWLVVADGRERSEIMGRRALGNVEPISADDVWKNVARNLSRQPEKGLALELLDHAREVNVGTVRNLATAFQPKQQREHEGREGTALHRTYAQRRDERAAAADTPSMAAAAAATAATVKLLAGPQTRKAAAAARKSRQSSSTPRQRKERRMSETEARAEFHDALRRAGLRPEGPPIMDGQKHRVAVEGDKTGEKSGVYIGHLDGLPAGYIHNFKGGEPIRWRASRPSGAARPEDRERARQASAASQAARNAQRIAREASVAQKAAAMWNDAKPASTAHHYLASKQVGAHGLRRDRRNKLLVPMQDVDGRLWGVQIISVDGRKMFLRDGRKHGTHAVLGELQPGAPVVIAEGFATAATMREVTGLPAIVAFDSGNLMEVARAIRERDPERPIIFAADNDHHLPRRPVPLPNIGLEKATAAAGAVEGIVLTPAFTAADKGTDWNDYAGQHGKPAVRTQLEETLRMKGIELPKPPQPVQVAKPAPRIVTQAERDAARAKTPSTATTSAADASHEVQQSRLRSRGPSM